ncbi:hypothetical protein ABMA28_003452 [Loxostege sticticalis]|uniref:Gag-like protein n=1 Tax=Loxostege sticticalis TaxID=481309 RepID=A0ABD0S8X9_LOXSC
MSSLQNPNHTNTDKEIVNQPPEDNTGATQQPNTQPAQSHRIAEPPSWQRVPVIRNPKRKKLSTPSPERLEISNRFGGLEIDANQDSSDHMHTQQVKRNNKPPPIILYGIEDVNKLTDLLETVTERTEFTYKIINKNQIKIMTSGVEVYKNLISLIRENKLIGHTFNRKDTKNYRIVIRNLHHTTPISAIKEAIENTGNTVLGEIINAKFGPDKKPTTTFFVNLVAVQCQRCQQYGHTKNYCMKPYRCVKCAEAHKTSECKKKDRLSPATCALCLGPHPANYKGCEVYKEIIKRKYPRGFPVSYKNENDNPENGNKNGKSQTQPINFNDVEEQPKKQDHREPNRSYARVTQAHKNPSAEEQSQPTITLEHMLLKQSEKIDNLLQQMSTLLQLITTLISKIVK